VMTIVRRALFVFLLLPVVAFAQTADQEVVSVVDAPDPVTPGANLAYTVTLTNHGPDPATGGGLNINLASALTHTTDSVPAGFTCFWLGNNGTCNMPSLPVGTYVLTINGTVSSSLATFPDQDISSNFFPSGTTIDPNNGNNSKLSTTTVDSPQVDLSVTASDSPDPVFPDGNITYSVTLTNSGPDTASSVNFNVVPNSSLAFQSVTPAAGWNCVPPAVGALNGTFTCSRATWAPGTSNFTIVYSANDENIGINDTTLNTFFGVGAGASDETDDSSDNSVTVSTQYTTPDADMNITATDSPDPVNPDGDITYTVTVTNQGPDAAPNANMQVIGNGGQTRFVSLTQPGGWSCNPPAPGTLLNVGGFQCTIASLANGASAVFTVVTEASDDLHPNSDHNITQAFTTGSSVTDPDNLDNQITVTTAYVVNDADMNITASDSPDPVSPDGDITYTVTVTNQGPDTATNAKMTIVGNGGQTRFQSITVPAGWSCATPAAGTLLNVANYDCTIASLANGASAVFTVVTEASDDLHPNSDHNITQNFVTSANEADPDNLDNQVTVTTLYDVSNADISVTNSDSPDPVAPGDTITYTQSITNGGPDVAANATFTQSTPAGTTFQSIAAPAGWSCGTPAVGATGAITCTKASLAVAETGAFTLVVNVTGGGTITSTVTGGSDANDPDAGDNTATTTTTSIAPATADLSITKTTPATTAPDGSTITYTIVVTNNGPDAAANVVMTDTLPASLLFRSITEPSGFDCTTPAVGTSGTITCTAATLANGASRTFTLVVEANGASGSVSNTAAVSSDATDGNAGNSGSTSSGVTLLPAEADLEITKTTGSSVAVPGSTVTYTITVTNAGPSDATNVVVSDDLPAGLAFISATPSQGSCNASDPVSCNLGTIINGGSATITLSAQVTATSGTISNTASVTSTEGDTDTTSSAPIPVGSAEVAAVPTVSEWGLLMLAMMLAVAAALKMRG
jgi:uncharacterized repeat protein (TIGR01451 family)